MTTIDAQGRPEPPAAAGEVEAALGFLDYQRATLEWKTRVVDADGMAATTAASSMTLGGVLKHLSWVEDYWFSVRLLGNDPDPYWQAVDWEADQDWEWTSAGEDSPDELRARWEAACAASRRCVETALADGGFDRPLAKPWADGTAPNLRWVVLHMIEEYARHNGHADLLREAVDGETGE